MPRKDKSQLSHWNKLINTDCKVYKIGDHYVYPIFKNASSSLDQVQQQVFYNEEIANCEDIHVLIRDPAERFVSGVNEYTRQHNLDITEVIAEIKDGKLMDRHFSPQWIWLLHLRKFYNGTVILRAFENIKEYCDVHRNKEDTKTTVEVPTEFVNADSYLLKHFDHPVSLDEIVKECKNVLSTT
jgi:hypothetical protein